MPISTEMMVRVAHADIALDMAFPRSIAHWHHVNRAHDPWKVLIGSCRAILIGKEDRIVIDGDCYNGASAPEGGLIHIYGDLVSKIDIGGLHEIVVTGDVGPDGTIEASGLSHVFVGGRFSGRLVLSGSAKVWIGSDFLGSLATGTPFTTVYVGQDYEGTIVPKETAALLSLVVSGFASHARLSKIMECGYLQFNASIGLSDVAPGLYPSTGSPNRIAGRSSHNRWCVLA